MVRTLADLSGIRRDGVFLLAPSTERDACPMRECDGCPFRLAAADAARYHRAAMPKPIQALLLVPLGFGWAAPAFFIDMAALGLALLALWWLNGVLSLLFGD